MAAPTNTYSSASAKGNREDLEDVIYRVAPEQTPFTSNIGKATAKAVKHEWQTEDLATPNASNATLEGDDVGTVDAANNTVRVSNTCQIFRKSGSVSGTQEAVNSAGRDSDLARQKVLKGIELRRDTEARFLGNLAEKVDESGATARTAAGALAWLVTNTSVGAGGANGGYSSGATTAASNGTQRAFTETQLKAVLASAFQNGGRPSQMYVGAAHKQAASAFTGIAQNRHEVGNDGSKVKIMGAADIYVSDFGEIAIIPVAYGLTRDALLIDPDMWAVATLRPVTSTELAKSGDSMKFSMVAEKTLVCRNEKASGAIRDLS